MLMSSTKKCAAISTTPAHARIAHRAGMDRGDRAAVGMAEQHAAPHASGIQHARQHVQRLVVHVVHRPRQRHTDPTRHSRSANRRTRRSRWPRASASGKVAPQRDAAQPLVQQHERRRRVRRAAPTTRVSSRCLSADDHRAAGSAGSCRSRSSAGRPRTRSSADISTRRSAPSRASFSSSFTVSASCCRAASCSTTKALRLDQPVAILARRPPPTSSTAGCATSASSTSNGETQMPLTFSISSVRPQKR